MSEKRRIEGGGMKEERREGLERTGGEIEGKKTLRKRENRE